MKSSVSFRQFIKIVSQAVGRDVSEEEATSPRFAASYARLSKRLGAAPKTYKHREYSEGASTRSISLAKTNGATQRAVVLAYVLAHPGTHRRAIAQDLNLLLSSVTPAAHFLLAQGLIKVSGVVVSQFSSREVEALEVAS